MNNLKAVLFLVMLFFTGLSFAGNELIVPVDGEKLVAILLNAQQTEAEAEEKLLAVISKLHVKDALRITPIDSKGNKGETVKPELENMNGKVKVTMGAVLDFDLDKYKNNVMLPMQEVLKQVSKGEPKKFTPKVEKYYLEIDEMSWEFGNLGFNRVKNLDRRLEGVGDCEIILNVFPNTANIFASKYESYNVRMTDKLETAFLQKIAEANLFDIHFVFKDNAGQELFHETYQALRKGLYESLKSKTENNAKGPRADAEYALFFTGRFYKKTYLPLMISPEIQGPFTSSNTYGQDKQLVICSFEADAANAGKISSYEIFVTEPEFE